MNRSKRWALGLAAAIGVGALASAQIERLDLRQMVAKTDNAVVGTITAKTFLSVPHPQGGGDLYFTTLTITGESLVNGSALTVDVSYMGADGEGVYSAEAPTATETEVGKRVIAFYKWSDDMGGGFASNGLYAAHGGLYSTFVNRRGQTVVQGRGEGYAVERNALLDRLDADITAIHESINR